jgi:hypothetical protein
VRILAALVLLGFASFALVGVLVQAGLEAGPAVHAVTLPLVLASAAGALVWSWAGGHMRPRVRRER